MADAVDLNFLARQMDRVLTEIGGLRDDMKVTIAMLTRIDERHALIINLMKDRIRQHIEETERIRKIEDAQP
jgi:hypothetical protein